MNKSLRFFSNAPYKQNLIIGAEIQLSVLFTEEETWKPYRYHHWIIMILSIIYGSVIMLDTVGPPVVPELNFLSVISLPWLVCSSLAHCPNWTEKIYIYICMYVYVCVYIYIYIYIYIYPIQSPAENQCCGSKYIIFGFGSKNFSLFGSGSELFHFDRFSILNYLFFEKIM